MAMKKYYKWANTGCFYCVTYDKRRIDKVVVVEAEDEKRVEFIYGKDFSKPLLKHCESISEGDFDEAYLDVMHLIKEAI